MRISRSFNESSFWQITVSACVGLLFVCLLPFAGALEVHHIFADIDHDGHEHSDFDLCQWVQAHGHGSIDLDQVDIGVPIQVAHEGWYAFDRFFYTLTLSSQESRGPPLFL